MSMFFVITYRSTIMIIIVVSLDRLCCITFLWHFCSICAMIPGRRQPRPSSPMSTDSNMSPAITHKRPRRHKQNQCGEQDYHPRDVFNDGKRLPREWQVGFGHVYLLIALMPGPALSSVPRLLHASEFLQPDVTRWLQSEGGHAATDGLWGGPGSTRQHGDAEGQGGCQRAEGEPGQAQESARSKRKQQKPTALRYRADYVERFGRACWGRLLCVLKCFPSRLPIRIWRRLPVQPPVFPIRSHSKRAWWC